MTHIEYFPTAEAQILLEKTLKLCIAYATAMEAKKINSVQSKPEYKSLVETFLIHTKKIPVQTITSKSLQLISKLMPISSYLQGKVRQII